MVATDFATLQRGFQLNIKCPDPGRFTPKNYVCKKTTLISKVIVYPGAKYEEAWPGNAYLGYPKFHVPMWKLFHEAFIVTE